MNLDKDTVKRIVKEIGIEPHPIHGGLIVRHSNGGWIDISNHLQAFATALLKEAHAGNEAVAYLHINDLSEYRLELMDLFDAGSLPRNVDISLYLSPPTQEACGPAVTAEYDLSPALVEGKIKNKLIELGWSPPQEVEAMKAKLGIATKALEFISKWDNGIMSKQMAFDVITTINNTNESQEPNTGSE